MLLGKANVFVARSLNKQRGPVGAVQMKGATNNFLGILTWKEKPHYSTLFKNLKQSLQLYTVQFRLTPSQRY